MSELEKNKLYFLSFCIEQYKIRKRMDGAEVANLFFTSGIASYLTDNFEVLHTQSHQWLMEEIDELLERRNQK